MGEVRVSIGEEWQVAGKRENDRQIFEPVRNIKEGGWGYLRSFNPFLRLAQSGSTSDSFYVRSLKYAPRPGNFQQIEDKTVLRNAD
jgi:hypothetical protein